MAAGFRGEGGPGAALLGFYRPLSGWLGATGCSGTGAADGVSTVSAGWLALAGRDALAGAVVGIGVSPTALAGLGGGTGFAGVSAFAFTGVDAGASSGAA